MARIKSLGITPQSIRSIRGQPRHHRGIAATCSATITLRVRHGDATLTAPPTPTTAAPTDDNG